jgi:hypothetical protein
MTEAEVQDGGKPGASSLTVTIGGGLWRLLFRGVIGFLLVTALGFLLVSVDAAQLTAAGTSHKILRRTAASLTEIDSLIAAKQETVTTSTSNVDSVTAVVAGFPIDVPLSTQEAQSLSSAELRDVILDRSADRLYNEGFSAFHEGGGTSTDVQILSPPGAVRYTAGLLTKDNHDIARIAMAVLAGFAALLALVLVLVSRGYGRLTSIGLAVLAASLPLLLLSVAVRFILRLASEEEGDYLTAQLYALGRDVAWLPIRNAIAFGCLGIIFLTLGLTFSFLSRTGEPYPS